MRGPRQHRRGFPVLAAGGIVALAAAATVAAAPPTAGRLRQANASLAAKARSATLGLYAIESQLTRARQRLGALRAQQARLEREQRDARTQLGFARRSLDISREQLAVRLRALYEQGANDPLAVILGADSLNDAIARLDDIDRTAAQDRDVIAQALAARARMRTLTRELARKQAQVAAAAASAATTAAQLVGARDARASLIARLARRRQLNARQIGALEAAARAAESKAASINRAAAPAPTTTGTDTPAAGGRTLTVSSTGYALKGRTATGVPVGWGVVAVDPSVIPLGTHMTIPGYGEGVAADTGGAVRGATIDLWFPTEAQARGWGRRVVVITLH